MEDKGNRILTLCVGGTIFKCYAKTLNTFPESKLARLDEQTGGFSVEDNEYFFDRNPLLFATILDSYRKDGVHLPKDTCGITFRKELEFWEISPHHVAPCCWEALYRSEDDIATVKYLTDSFERNSNQHLVSKEKGDLRAKLWLILDEPRSSRLAWVWCVFISVVILAAILADSMASLDTFQENFTSTQIEALTTFADALNFDNTTLAELTTRRPKAFLLYINVMCHAILTIELVLSFVICQNKTGFLSCSTRLVTGFGYLSYWIFITLFLNMQHFRSVYAISVQNVFQYMSIFKLARLFYITKSVPAFRIICLTFYSCKQEIKMLVFLLVILVCVFGYILFAAEFYNDSSISNIFIAIYWALITLTTVGYGNYVPETAAGHVIAGACAVCGVLVLAMPVGVIVSKFSKYYNFHQYRKEHARITAQVGYSHNGRQVHETETLIEKTQVSTRLSNRKCN